MKRLAVKLVHAYESVQVELHGKYSIQRVAEFDAYQRTISLRQCFAVFVATPLPCLTVIMLMDLVPLRPPTDGPRRNGVLWSRAFLVSFAIAATLLEQGRQFVPGLPCSNRMIVVMSVTVALCTTAYAVLMAYAIGFPIPFMVICCSPSFLSSLAIVGSVQWGRLVRAHRPLRQALLAYVKIMVVQFALTAIYPAFNYLFLQYAGYKQTAVAMLLPVLKLVAKNAVSLAFNPKLEDFKPEGVILNVEVFHALFVSCCMQSSTSWVTTVALMCTDFVHALFGLRDVDERVAKINALDAKLHAAASSATTSMSLVEKALFFVRSDGVVERHASVRHRPDDMSVVATPRLAAIAPLIVTPPTVPTLGDTNTTNNDSPFLDHSLKVLTTRERVAYVSNTLQVLHITEFLLLIEFVEVVVPVIYSVYLTAMYALPNRVYYTQLAKLDSQSLFAAIGNVLGYASLEFLSFVGLCMALRRKLQFSPMRQLAFVLHTQWSLVQSKMILWVVFAVHVSLIHFGYDYSFRFAWLCGA